MSAAEVIADLCGDPSIAEEVINKMHAEIIAEMRFHGQQNIDAEKDKPEFGILTMEGRIVQNYANELEAAHKREVEKLNSVIQATVSHSDAEIDRLRREAEELRKKLGNTAKLRKALGIVYDWILKAGNVYGYPDTEQKRRQLYDMMTSALAAPARNCDVIPSKDLVDEFCKSLGYDVMDERNGYADGQNRFMQEHWFEFSKWITMPYEQTKGDINGSK